MSSTSIDDLPKVMGDDGEFHAVDEAVDLSHTPIEAWVSLVIFWALGAVVFYQFFTRYVLNDSAAWTEEIARYLLIGTVFVGASIGVAKNNHIQVDLLYRYLPGTDGLPGTEGAFVACTFWLVQALAKTGRVEDAESLFDAALALATPLGLFAEEIDPGTRDALGNFPQAFTHVGLINAALSLIEREEQDRRQGDRTGQEVAVGDNRERPRPEARV